MRWPDNRAARPVVGWSQNSSIFLLLSLYRASLRLAVNGALMLHWRG